MTQVPVGPDRVALVDDADAEDVRRFCWHLHVRDGYAMARLAVGRRQTTMLMHRLILGRFWPVPPGYYADHVNCDGLDNRRANLRIVNPIESAWNRRVHRDNSTGFKGVYVKGPGKWVASITCQGNQRYLGTFTDLEEAARIYDAAARETFGVYARLNFCEDESGMRGAR